MMKNRTDHYSTGGIFFSSPQEAVPVVTELLRNKDFKTLSKYYDLSDSGLPLSRLETGDFFIRKKRPGSAHPAGFWRYRHPFPPGFSFRRISPGMDENVFIITVEIKIHQGTGSPEQTGRAYFSMKKSSKGWQILPAEVSENDRRDEIVY